MAKIPFDISKHMKYNKEQFKQRRLKMSEAKRTLEDVKRDYAGQCTIIGDRKYRMAVMEAEVNTALNRINELNEEANKLEKEAQNGSAATTENVG